ncbi:aspartic peptidase domain-containing protein [Mycena crocata]|nr:aspartic peptidase domain-containing protein [Mycena crocata]
MFPSALSSAVLLLATQSRLAAAIGLPNPADVDSHAIQNNRNSRYTAAIVIGGQVINVTLDSGSTDLWLDPPGGVSGFDSTGVDHEIVYGDGSAFINGTIGLANISFAGYTIPRQAFINVTTNVGFNECGNDICGLVGLGFDHKDWGISKALTDGGYDGPVIGKSVLSSIFDQSPTPSLNRFFAISLSRLNDTSSPHASLRIGEVEPAYEAVLSEPKRPVYPPGQTSWHVLTDGISVNGVKIYWPKNSRQTPPGSNRIGLDTGVPNLIMRKEVVDRIYSQVPGAVLATNTTIRKPYWTADEDVWVVPCSTSIEFEASFGGQKYPIHPLDLTVMQTQRAPDGKDYTICSGAITNGGGNSDGEVEAQFGDSFLRNVYTVFSFGDNDTAPYVQFLSQTNPREALQDFIAVRSQQLDKGAPELAPADLIALFDRASSPADSSSNSSSDSSSSDSSSIHIDGACLTNSTSTSTTGRVALADASADSDFKASKYAPIIIGLLGANLLLLIVLVGLGVVSYVRGGRTTGAARRSVSPSASIRYAPVTAKKY